MSNRHVLLEHRTILRLSGGDARGFLQGLVTQDITTVNENHSAWTAMLSAQGKYLYDFFVIAVGDGLLLDCDSSQAEELAKMLSIYKLRADVQIENLKDAYHVVAAIGDLTPLALPESPGRTERFGDTGQIIAFIDSRHAGMAARIIAPQSEGETWVLQRGYAQASIADYEARRISLGIPRAGIDSVPQKTLILENGFEELHGVSFNKGCYVGQEVTARTKHRANLRKRLYIVHGNAPLPEAGTDITLDGKNAGTMRSSAGAIGLAVLRDDAVHKASDTTPLTAGDSTLRAENPPWRNQTD